MVAGGTTNPIAVSAGLLAGGGLVAAAAWWWERNASAGRPNLAGLARAVFVGRSTRTGGHGWRRAWPWERRELLRMMRTHPAVVEVVARSATPKWWWRTATVRVRGELERRMALLVVKGPGARLQILAPQNGAPAVLCYTPSGVVVPRRSAGRV